MKTLVLKLFIILTLFSLNFPKFVWGQENINKFGIHISEPGDLDKARELVGDWGWITIVITENDLNQDKWQDFMNLCREKHLIPLVRIATQLEGTSWAKPKVENAQKWADFLNSLNWPVKDQYVIIFNEPNHAKEWGGEINPKEYARILSEFSSKLKVPLQGKQSSKFQVLNAGFDLAAPNGKETMDAYKFIQEMKAEIPDIFEKLDGWASHSYPNHGFIGKPWETGRVSIRGYDWELWTLKNHFGLKKDLSVFITETGWPKNSRKYYDEVTAAAYLKNAYETVWLKDSRVMAVTPFILNYPDGLFAEFSWFDKSGEPYPQYELVKSMDKQFWWPEQVMSYKLKSISLPTFLPAKTNYEGKVILENTGQSIWGENGNLSIPVKVEGIEISDLTLAKNNLVKPGEKAELDFLIKSASESGVYVFSWKDLPEQKIKVLPDSILSQARYNLWEKFLIKIKEVF